MGSPAPDVAGMWTARAASSPFAGLQAPPAALDPARVPGDQMRPPGAGPVVGLALSQGLFNKQHVCVLGSGFLCITYAPRGLVFWRRRSLAPFPGCLLWGSPDPSSDSLGI